ncbi:UNVERIFIED_CONTAM: hypothetical protein FKN15_018689 [Acipenser sinensis]
MGSVDKAEPMQATPAEGPEGEEEQPLPEQEMPQAPVSMEETDSAPEASVDSADNVEPMQATLAEGSEGGEEPPQEQDLPQASLSRGDGGFGPRAAAEGDEETPPEAEAGSAEPALTLVSEARKGGEEPERAEGGALEKAAEWTTVARRKKKAAARSTGAAERGATKPTAVPSGGGSGGVPEKGTPPTAPPAMQGGKAARKTKHLIPTEGEEKSAAGGELPVAVTRQGTASGSLRGKRKAQARLPTCAQKCTRTGLMVGVPGGAKEGPPKPKRPPRRPPSAGNEGPGPRYATERVKDPSPEAVRGSSEEAVEPMEEAPAERPKGRAELVRAEEALRVDPLPIIQQTSEAGPDTEGPAAAEVAEGAQKGPPKEQLPRAPPSSDGDTGPETCVAEGGWRNQLPRQAWAEAPPAEGPEGEEELPLPEHEPPRAPEASVGSADNAEPMQATLAGGSEGGEEHPQPEQELPQASLSCCDGGFGPRAAAEGDEETPPEAEAGSAEPAGPALTLVSGARKGGEEPERAEGGALEVDPLPEVQRGQIPVTEGGREEPLKEQPPRASLSGGDEGSSFEGRGRA